ncbi:MAG TPA: phosphate uptake regulator PhoU [Bacteroidales bacterium]|nr:phosphate uptake regulator PhoU [Bacteroidales bacterium]
MNIKKEQSIKEFLTSFNEMADLVLAQLTLIEKLMTGKDKKENMELLSSLKSNEKEIDKYEVSMSERFINIIVLYQPVASDIRRFVAMYRMVLNLERIGDLIMNITHNLETLRETKEYKAMTGVIQNMLLSGRIMVEKSLLSFVNNDADYAIWTIKNDSVVDEMNQKLLINSISKARISEETKRMLLSYSELKNIITNIERIADHATNIAEATIYSLQGTDVRHTDLDKEKNDNQQ